MKLYYKIIATALIFVLNGCATTGTYLRLDPALEPQIRSIGGVHYLPLDQVSRTYGMECSWDGIIQKAHVHARTADISLRAGSDLALVNGVTERLDKPAVMYDGKIYVPVSFVRKRLGPIAAKEPAVRPPVETIPGIGIRTVVLDPGHGGRDNGATGRRLRLKEKEVALDLADKIKAELEANGLKVIMTRSGDAFVPLQRRVDIANAAGADLFVSVHINASRSRRLRGFECYYRPDADDPDNRDGSASLAGNICASVDKSLVMADSGVKQARFYVLKQARMPAVLVEAGYLSNRLEERELKDPAFLDKVASAVTDGIMRFKKERDRAKEPS